MGALHQAWPFSAAGEELGRLAAAHRQMGTGGTSSSGVCVQAHAPWVKHSPLDGSFPPRLLPTRSFLSSMHCWLGVQSGIHSSLLSKHSAASPSDVQGKIKSLESIYLFSMPVKECQIVDYFLGPSLKDEVMKIMPVQKQTRAGQRTRFKVLAPAHTELHTWNVRHMSFACRLACTHYLHVRVHVHNLRARMHAHPAAKYACA